MNPKQKPKQSKKKELNVTINFKILNKSRSKLSHIVLKWRVKGIKSKRKIKINGKRKLKIWKVLRYFKYISTDWQ